MSSEFYRVTLYRVAGVECNVIPEVEYPSAAYVNEKRHAPCCVALGARPDRQV